MTKDQRVYPTRTADRCSDCPPAGYPTEKTRCYGCPLANTYKDATGELVIPTAAPSSNERSLLKQTADLLREMREDIFQRGTLSGRSQRAGDDLLRRIDTILITPVETTAHRPAVFRHKKTGNLYERLHEALESTNGALEGLPMVVYRRMDTQGVYVREAEEFAEKFERVTDSSSVEPTRDDPNAPFRWICPKCTTVNAFEDKVCVSCRHELHHYHVSCQCPDCNARHIGFRMRAEKASGDLAHKAGDVCEICGGVWQSVSNVGGVAHVCPGSPLNGGAPHAK